MSDSESPHTAEKPASVEDIDWETISYLTASTNRTAVAVSLANDGPATPTEISDGTDLTPTHVSRAVRQLRDKNLAELLVPEDTHKGRVYGLTDRGSRALEHVDWGDA